ncbi:hypothetical protein L596_025442 [Steinernema carpocapsae]|uniref:Uncharacterized protein n=1 Tax=Steinernema carpocapsae TaxID=34508 RepID=A0A4U5M7S0_STECR|nr:hypothetical protein L596_025442 [Steinernema carpocapsae]
MFSNLDDVNNVVKKSKNGLLIKLENAELVYVKKLGATLHASPPKTLKNLNCATNNLNPTDSNSNDDPD